MKNKNITFRKITLIFLLACIILTVSCFSLGWLAHSTGLSLRGWLSTSSWILAAAGLPLSLELFCLCRLFGILECETVNTRKILARAGIAVLLLAGVIYTLAAMLFFILLNPEGREKEVRLSSDVIQVTRYSSGYNSEKIISYYKPIGPIFRKEYAFDDEPVVRSVLNTRYDTTFILSEKAITNKIDSTRPVTLYQAVPADNPELVFHAAAEWDAPHSYYDDYTEVRTYLKAQKYALQYFPQRTLFSQTGPVIGMTGALTLSCRGDWDISSCAMDAAGIISNLLEDPFYVLHEFSLFIEYGKYGSSLENSGSIELTFGGPDSPPLIHQQQRAELPEIIEHMLKDAMRQYDQTAQEKWEDQTVQETQEELLTQNGQEESITQDTQEESMDRSDTSQKHVSAETASTEWTASSVDSDGLLTPEGAFDKLFAAVFAPGGYAYECTYNAKGNFYAILSEWETENGEQKLHVRKTAVYDRISTNGKCQLFVCYNEYTTLDGGEWNTEIDNFYAVDRKTGKVTAGNKTSWSQPASKAYQEATGDK